MTRQTETHKADIFTSKVVLNGRITIPENIRAIWDINETDIVEFKVLSVHKEA